MDKEVVVHIYNAILLSHNKEHIWVSSSDVNKPRAGCTEWSKSERKKQILHINAYMWNLEKMVLMNLFAGRNRDSGRENRLMDTVGAGEGGTNWESSMEIYTLLYVK